VVCLIVGVAVGAVDDGVWLGMVLSKSVLIVSLQVCWLCVVSCWLWVALAGVGGDWGVMTSVVAAYGAAVSW